MDSISQTFVDRERVIPQRLSPSAKSRSSGAYPFTKENNAGDNNKTTNNSSQRVEELEKLLSRLNNAMLTLEEENLKLHKRLRADKVEVNTQETSPVDHSGRFRDMTDGNSSVTSQLQENGYSQLKIENNSLKKKLKEAEKSSKQSGRDIQNLLQRYEDLKAQNQILEQHNKQLATEKRTLEEKLYSLRSEKIQEEKMGVLAASERAATRMGSQTEGCRSRRSFDNTTNGQGEGSEALSETVAHLKEENKVLKEKLRQSTERGTQVEESARRLLEEQTILENCLRTVQQEKELLQVEVRALHQDYISLSGSITLQLREQTNGNVKVSEVCGSSTSALRRCTSSDNITPSRKDKGSEARRSTGSTCTDKAPDDCVRTAGQEMKTSMKGTPTQTVKQGHIDKDTIEKIRIRFEEEELKKAQRLKGSKDSK